MFKKQCFIAISSLCVLFQTFLSAAIENSVVPTIKKFENIENLPKEKINDRQFKVIEKALSQIDQKVRIVSYNLLCDDREGKSEEINKWHNRLPRVVELFQEMQPDVFCVQEQYQHQLDAWLPQIGENYSFYGSPRGDGEVNGILYRNDRLDLICGDVMRIPSQREKFNTVTMAQLRDLKTGKSFAIFTLHMSFSSNNERADEAEFILKQMTSVAQQMPVILTGDLNLFPIHLEESFPYFDGGYVHQILTKELLKDSQEIALLGHVGPLSSFTNLPGPDTRPFQGLGTPGVMLDRAYVSQGIEVIIHAVEPAKVNGCFPSDHMPLLVDFIIAD
jgi:endonuclease/exonuclease/phosphatase family metal-dependent hydrolase